MASSTTKRFRSIRLTSTTGAVASKLVGGADSGGAQALRQCAFRPSAGRRARPCSRRMVLRRNVHWPAGADRNSLAGSAAVKRGTPFEETDDACAHPERREDDAAAAVPD